MKRFEELFDELRQKTAVKDPSSRTVKEIDAGIDFIGKKLVEEAAESWMAARHEGKQRTAEELSQLLYHIQVMIIASGLTLEDVYKYL
ncbi:MAG: phosphoribosyl-ATP diphosphatase [Spirochaetales bacterium]|nr:phosphoribosyl-ATP diphosphatase [Spirochaetales bacterium]